MYLGQARCKRCAEPINAKWYEEISSYDIKGHILKKADFQADGTLNLECVCIRCNEHNALILNVVE